MYSDDQEPAGTITFRDDNTYTANVDGDVENGTWTVSSDGKTLTVASTEDGMEYTDNLAIDSLTSSELRLELPVDSEDIDFDDDRVDDTTIDFSMTLILTK